MNSWVTFQFSTDLSRQSSGIIGNIPNSKNWNQQKNHHGKGEMSFLFHGTTNGTIYFNFTIFYHHFTTILSPFNHLRSTGTTTTPIFPDALRLAAAMPMENIQLSFGNARGAGMGCCYTVVTAVTVIVVVDC